MKTLNKPTIAVATLFLTLIGGCATGTVNESDRDTTGAFDGTWVGSVAGPRSSVETLPGYYRMLCEWDPFTIKLTIADGQAQLGSSEQKSFVSKKGQFRFFIQNSKAEMVGGVMLGNADFAYIFSGKLSDSKAQGKYMEIIPSIAGTGCSSKIQFSRTDG